MTWEREHARPLPRADYEKPVPDWVLEQSPGTHRPESELEQLMTTPPGGHPDMLSNVDTGDTYDNLENILGVDLELDEIEKDVLDALFVAGLSIRDASQTLGIPQTTVWRVKESAMTRIRKRINMHSLEETV